MNPTLKLAITRFPVSFKKCKITYSFSLLILFILMITGCQKEENNGDGSVISCNFNGVAMQWIGDNTSIGVTQVSGKGQMAAIKLASLNNTISLAYTIYFSENFSTSTPADTIVLNTIYSYPVQGFSFTDSHNPGIYFTNISNKLSFTRISNNTADGTFETIAKGFKPLDGTYVTDTISNGIFKNVKITKTTSLN